MNAKSNAKNTQPTVQSDAATWQNFIVEELSDEAQAAVSGGLTWVSKEEFARLYWQNPTLTGG
jgi:hypothetical protein